MFTGFSKASVFALGIMPYISASIGSVNGNSYSICKNFKVMVRVVEKDFIHVG
jgi:hypothetical protein